MATNRVASRINGLFGKTIDPMVLESELYRLHPEITSVEAIPVNQLDLLLTTTYNKIMTGDILSDRQLFEDVVLPKLPKLPTTDADMGKSYTRKLEKDRYWEDDPVRLLKSGGIELIDQFQKKAGEIAKKRAVISRKREIVRQEIDKLPHEWNYGEEELQALEGKIKEQIDSWTKQMDGIVRRMMNSMDIDSVGDFVSKYSQFKQALKYSISGIKWQAMNKAREELAAEKPVKNIAKAFGAMRNLGKSFFGTDDFNDKILKSIEYNIVSYFDEDKGIPYHSTYQKAIKHYEKGNKHSRKGDSDTASHWYAKAHVLTSQLKIHPSHSDASPKIKEDINFMHRNTKAMKGME